MTTGTFLCFDYGEKRIGVAVGQSRTETASPLTTIDVTRNTPEWSQITRLIDEWQPQAMVVGLPLTMDDGRQPLTESAQRFARQLEGRYRLPVHMADERLSTWEAKARTQSTDNLDPVAAQIILEGWLREYKSPDTKK